MFLELKKNFELELNKENIKLINIGIEDCVVFFLSFEDNLDCLIM